MFACGSKSIAKTLRDSANLLQSRVAMVVLPTPPFMLITEMATATPASQHVSTPVR